MKQCTTFAASKLFNSSKEHCAKLAQKEKEPFIALLAYVDDCCITGNCPELIDALVSKIKTDFNGKLDDLGDLHHFLGAKHGSHRVHSTTRRFAGLH